MKIGSLEVFDSNVSTFAQIDFYLLGAGSFVFHSKNNSVLLFTVYYLNVFDNIFGSVDTSGNYVLLEFFD